MRVLLVMPLLLLMGCHPRVRIGSPQFQRTPEVTCIILVEGNISTELAKEAVDACKKAVAKQ